MTRGRRLSLVGVGQQAGRAWANGAALAAAAPGMAPRAVADRSGRAAMSAGDRKLRIAIAVFESARSLGPAIERLLDGGVPLKNIGLIALRATARQMAASEQADGRDGGPLTQLIKGLAPLSASHDSGIEIMASPGVVSPWYTGLRAPGLWAGEHPVEAAPRLAADLERHVERGATILAVESATPSEHWHCARILLEQSCSPILALECSLPPAT
jgi:hypothetical protein